MKRWMATEFGDPAEVLTLHDVDMPEPAAGEAVVRVLTASVALPDLMMVRGEYPMVPTPPVSPGQEVVGVVERAGAGFPHPVGTTIAGNARSDIAIGGLAQYTRVPGWSAFEVMQELTDEQAVGFSGSFHVAHIGLHHRAGLRPGQTLLVLGGAGRTGSAAIQVGKALGATVIATARTEAKAQFCRDQGADHVLDLGDPAATTAIGDWTAGRGVDVLYDTVGGQAFTAATSFLARGATALVVGFASGTIAQPDAQHMLMGDYAMAGVLSTFRDDEERATTLTALSSMLRAGQIAPPVNAVYPFQAVPDAMTHRAADATGQTVITLTEPDGFNDGS